MKHYTVLIRRPEFVMQALDALDTPYYVAQVEARDAVEACHVARHEVRRADYTDMESSSSARTSLRDYEVVCVLIGHCAVALHSFQVPQ